VPADRSQEHAVIRLLIVDDHAVVREGLRLLFATTPGIEVVGMAGDGAVAVEQARVLAPDVVLMDLGMPVVDGIEATRRIVARDPDARVVVLTSYTDQDRIVAALDAGALGYVLKHSDSDVVVRAIRAAYVGESVLDPAADRVLAARPDCPPS
jgi:DNA-binding NarL/FixJ family response regulator